MIAWEVITGFSLLVFLVLALPFVPAARTLTRAPHKIAPKEVPLSPVSQCETFRHLVKRQFGHLLGMANANGAQHGVSESGRPYIVLGINSHLAEQLKPDTRRVKQQIISAGHLDIPGELICEREIFAEGKINVGHNTMIRSALSPRDIAINTKARVTRWVRTDRRLDIAEGAFVRGWARAEIEITLARRARFEHLSAPLISFGRRPPPPPAPEELAGRYTPPRSEENEDGSSHRKLSVPERHIAKGKLIATETLCLGKGSCVIGDLHAGDTLVIGPNCRVEGTIYCDGEIVIHESCQISGPVIAGVSVLIHANTRIGSAEEPTTLTAPRLRIAEGCMAYGKVEALRRGDVFLDESAITPS